MDSQSFLVRPTSGFVPLSDGGPAVAEKIVVARPAARDAVADTAAITPRWRPAARGVVYVEALTLGLVCTYFAFGLGRALGVF